MTTRLLMALVALAAVATWAGMNAPTWINRANDYRAEAKYQADWERSFRDQARASSARVAAIQAELEEWRRESGSADRLTEHYFDLRREFEILNANYLRDMADYHAKLKNRYRWGSWLPFISVPPNPQPPAAPLVSQPVKTEPGKIYETVSNGGISIRFSPGGAELAVGSRDTTFRFLELPSRRVLASCLAPQGTAVCGSFSADIATLFSVGFGRVVWRFDVATGRALPALPWTGEASAQPGSLGFATAVACSPDGRTIAIAASGFDSKIRQQVYAVRLVDIRTGRLKWEHKGKGESPPGVAFSPDGHALAYAAGPVVLLDVPTGNVKKTLKPIVGSAIALAFSPDGRMLAGGGSNVTARGGSGGNGRISVWNVSTGAILQTLGGPTGPAQTVAFSPDGRSLAAGGTGSAKVGKHPFTGRIISRTASEVRLWDAATGKPSWTAEGESGAAVSLAFSPDGKSLAYCDADYVYILSADTGRLRQIVLETVTTYRARDRPPPRSAGAPAGR